MTFRAKLRRNRPVWTAWRHRHAAGGEVAGVAFRWCPGDDYATGDLTADEVKRLHGNEDVLMECFGAATESSAAVEPMPAPTPAEPPDSSAYDAEDPDGSKHLPGWRRRAKTAAAR